MSAASRVWARRMLRVWFHDLRPRDWFGGGEAVDDLLASEFAQAWQMLRSRPAEEFMADQATARAAILLFDQVPRNVHRGTAQAFASDRLARAITHGFIARDWLTGLSEPQKQFVLMPLMHSEHIADQRLSIEMFARHASGSLAFARSHWRMIARFGRFPHRNPVPGRATSPREQAAIDRGFSW